MGGGSTRKASDAPRINTPKSSLGGQGGGSFLSDKGDINHVCPLVVRILINSLKSFPDGALVTVKNGELHVLGENVGQLQQKQVELFERCWQLGIKYTGRTLNEDGRAYVQFEQTE